MHPKVTDIKIPKPLKSPILFMVFNRPNTTGQVFEAVRQARPLQLFIAADGPRENRHDDLEKCAEARRIVSEGIDWDCEVKTLFRERNLGCKMAVSTAIDWFFEDVEEGIILEDDCLPSHDFFRLCEDLLEHYRYDSEVMHIGGTNPIATKLRSNTYYFSKYNRIWGWATWRRAWEFFDVGIGMWPEMKETQAYYHLFDTRKEADIWAQYWDDTYNGVIDTWDYQWFLCRLLHGVAIIPDVNLVSNIGFDGESTHALDPDSPLSNLQTGRIAFPLVHPRLVVADKICDRAWSKYIISSRPNLILRLKTKLAGVLRRIWQKSAS